MTTPSNWRAQLRRIASGVVFWTGLIVIGIIAVPAGIFIGIIFCIWKVISFIIKKIDKD